MKKTSCIFLFALGGGLFSSLAIGQTSPWYVGAGVGMADSNVQANIRNDLEQVGGFKLDDRDTTWSIFGGYTLNEYLDVELGYVNLGKTTGSGNVGGVVSLDVKSETEGLMLSVIGHQQVTPQIDLYARAGLYRWDTTTTLSTVGFGSKASISQDEDGTDLTFGIGASYDFGGWRARLEWQHFNGLGEMDYDTLTAGIVYPF